MQLFLPCDLRSKQTTSSAEALTPYRYVLCFVQSLPFRKATEAAETRMPLCVSSFGCSSRVYAHFFQLCYGDLVDMKYAGNQHSP